MTSIAQRNTRGRPVSDAPIRSYYCYHKLLIYKKVPPPDLMFRQAQLEANAQPRFSSHADDLVDAGGQHQVALALVGVL